MVVAAAATEEVVMVMEVMDTDIVATVVVAFSEAAAGAATVHGAGAVHGAMAATVVTGRTICRMTSAATTSRRFR